MNTGTPGSGKSLRVAKEVNHNLCKRKRAVIANFPINYDSLTRGLFGFKKKVAQFTYADNQTMTPQYFYDYAMANNLKDKQGNLLFKEGQTMVYIDECQVMFNPREFGRKDRLEWITFFTQHRKLGYHFVLITQNDRLIDRQIRDLAEYEVKHRKLNNFGPFVLLNLFGIKLFLSITYWYTVRERVQRDLFVYRRKYGNLYNTMMMFEGSIKNVEMNQPEEVIEVQTNDSTQSEGEPSLPAQWGLGGPT